VTSYLKVLVLLVKMSPPLLEPSSIEIAGVRVGLFTEIGAKESAYMPLSELVALQ